MALEIASPARRGRSIILLALALGISTLVGCDRITAGFAAKKEAAGQRFVGTWVAFRDGKTEALEIREDGTYRYVFIADAAIDFSGKWDINGAGLELQVEKAVGGNRVKIGDLVQWSIVKVEPNQLVLNGFGKEPTTYTRQVKSK
jgi:hypothetical protein